MAADQSAASLPMYDWPEIEWATDALWTAIAERFAAGGIPAPVRLDRTRPSEQVWRDPSLVLSQTCGFPYATRLRGAVQLVATPVYSAEGCRGAYYSSAIVVRRGGRPVGRHPDISIAFNSRDSLSGFVAVRAWMRERGLDPRLADWVEVGSHRAAIQSVAGGEADMAGIDAVCWGLAKSHEPAAAVLEVMNWTARRPALPFVTAGGRAPEQLATIRAAIEDALASPATEAARQALLLKGCAEVADAEYVSLRALGDRNSFVG